MTALVIYPLVTVALYYLGAWAFVTRWLWSRYPARLNALMLCASCSGFWYGVLVALVLGRGLDLDLLALSGDAWTTPLVAGLCSLVWTPPLARLLLEANAVLGDANTHRLEVRQTLEDHAQAEESERPVLAGPRSR